MFINSTLRNRCDEDILITRKKSAEGLVSGDEVVMYCPTNFRPATTTQAQNWQVHSPFLPRVPAGAFCLRWKPWERAPSS